jgi:hypothetical protein
MRRNEKKREAMKALLKKKHFELLLLLLRAKRFVERIWSFFTVGSICFGFESTRFRAFNRRIKWISEDGEG